MKGEYLNFSTASISMSHPHTATDTSHRHHFSPELQDYRASARPSVFFAGAPRLQSLRKTIGLLRRLVFPSESSITWGSKTAARSFVSLHSPYNGVGGTEKASTLSRNRTGDDGSRVASISRVNGLNMQAAPIPPITFKRPRRYSKAEPPMMEILGVRAPTKQPLTEL
ncbi:hypothetical protein IGI04_002732 [Brassica rapa subsp. trilocularis]|uniref:Uncharacterized protein n=1 Tax=Brassica rapa subsp. trilocularis TaxID=1813537 RepID=A0ABQ7NYI3_BRACM|nr:hypothetical protein IGI04_002732 [Brassica rapa subsp. trilocularis]